MEWSGAAIFASFVVSTIGFSFFLYGKKQARLPHLVVGVAMMAFPYFVESVGLVYAIAGAMIVGLWFWSRMD